jgi:hypothetical protein
MEDEVEQDLTEVSQPESTFRSPVPAAVVPLRISQDTGNANRGCPFQFPPKYGW